MVLYRPVGTKELALIEESHFQRFPERLPEQSIFYPVLNERYAIEIASKWNQKYNEDKQGYVVRFEIKEDYISLYDVQTVGAPHHQEFWIPAENLEEFNANIVGKIEVIHRFLDLNERIKGGLWGLIIGDALGVPYEFHSPKDIPTYEDIEFVPPPTFRASYAGLKPGTWSDDSAQALCLLDSLLERNGFELENFAQKLLLWYDEGLWAVDQHVFDCGMQTSAALYDYGRGISAEKSGFVHPDGKGNGALMRVLPLVLWYQDQKDLLICKAHEQCLVTHGHECNQVCCALYCLWGSELLLGGEIQKSYTDAVAYLAQFYRTHQMETYAYELMLLQQEGTFSGGGYVVDSMRSAKHLLFTYTSYESVVKEAIRLGHDTDTTAAIAGGLAGLYYGSGNIPKRWVHALRDREKVEEIVSKLFIAQDRN